MNIAQIFLVSFIMGLLQKAQMGLIYEKRGRKFRDTAPLKRVSRLSESNTAPEFQKRREDQKDSAPQQQIL